jgi:hypothetical protein
MDSRTRRPACTRARSRSRSALRVRGRRRHCRSRRAEITASAKCVSIAPLHVAHHDASRAAVDDDQIEHLGARNIVTPPFDLLLQRLIRAEAGTAVPFARARETFAIRARQQRFASKPPYSRARRRAHATHWSMMLTLICASPFASRREVAR